MNAPFAKHPVASATFGEALIVDASKVSPSEFFAVATARFFPAPKPDAIGEKAAAARRFISAAWGASPERVAELRVQFEIEKAEIDERYSGWVRIEL